MKRKENSQNQVLRNRLLVSNEAILSGVYPAISKALLKRGLKVRNAFIIDCIPEQAEDIYFVLADGKSVLEIEVQRDGTYFDVIERNVEEYRKICSKTQSSTIKIALQISKEISAEIIDLL
jgi:hypothetical protein